MTANRQPPGIPAGGQFATGAHADPGTDSLQAPAIDVHNLTEEEIAENNDGTFFAPAYPISANQLVAFWTQTEVPERSITIFIESWHLLHGYNGEIPYVEERRVIHSSHARTLMRAYLIHRHSNLLSVEERQKVLAHRLPFVGTGGKNIQIAYITDGNSETSIDGYHVELIHQSWMRQPDEFDEITSDQMDIIGWQEMAEYRTAKANIAKYGTKHRPDYDTPKGRSKEESAVQRHLAKVRTE